MRRLLSCFIIVICCCCLFSCASIKLKSIDFKSSEVPQSFDSCRIAFISDLHYKSLLKENGLRRLVKLLVRENPDLILLGGDYQEGCQYVTPLFNAIGSVKPNLGIYGVMGNNDYERCYDEICNSMKLNDIHLLEHKTDTVWNNHQFILISGVRNPFDLSENGVSPTLSLAPKDFVILLVHTPDYAESVDISNTDLVLAGHTHGGQIRVLGYAPIVPSRYGKRFLCGLKHTSKDIPMFITKGIGTSRRNIRIGARSEVVMITLSRPI